MKTNKFKVHWFIRELIILSIGFHIGYLFQPRYYMVHITTEPEHNEQKYDVCVTLRGTTYQPVAAQCDSDPLCTANMTKVDLQKLKTGEQRLCALSYDIKHKYGFKFGDQFDVFTAEGDSLGRYIFCDHMNRRIKNTCDLMIHPDAKPTLYKNMVIKRIKSLECCCPRRIG